MRARREVSGIKPSEHAFQLALSFFRLRSCREATAQKFLRRGLAWRFVKRASMFALSTRVMSVHDAKPSCGVAPASRAVASPR